MRIYGPISPPGPLARGTADAVLSGIAIGLLALLATMGLAAFVIVRRRSKAAAVRHAQAESVVMPRIKPLRDLFPDDAMDRPFVASLQTALRIGLDIPDPRRRAAVRRRKRTEGVCWARGSLLCTRARGTGRAGARHARTDRTAVHVRHGPPGRGGLGHGGNRG